ALLLSSVSLRSAVLSWLTMALMPASSPSLSISLTTTALSLRAPPPALPAVPTLSVA
ncbi:hypothetical protein BG015_006053, partial [Linnemannia schmuckeri]